MGELIPDEQPVVSPPQDVAGEPVTATPPSDENAQFTDANEGAKTNQAVPVTESAISQEKSVPNAEDKYVKPEDLDLSKLGENVGEVLASATPEVQRLTFGENLVGKTFNPSNNPKVDKVKSLCAELADLVQSHGDPTIPVPHYTGIFYDGALDRILDAQMWAVKYITAIN